MCRKVAVYLSYFVICIFTRFDILNNLIIKLYVVCVQTPSKGLLDVLDNFVTGLCIVRVSGLSTPDERNYIYRAIKCEAIYLH